MSKKQQNSQEIFFSAIRELERLSGIILAEESSTEYDPKRLFDIVDKAEEIIGLFEEILSNVKTFYKCINYLFNTDSNDFPVQVFEDNLKNLSFTIQKFKEINGRTNGVKNLEDMISFGHSLLVAMENGTTEFGLLPRSLDEKKNKTENNQQENAQSSQVNKEKPLEVVQSTPMVNIVEKTK